MTKDSFVPKSRFDLCDYIKSKYCKDGCIALWNVGMLDNFGEWVFCKHEKCSFYSKEGSIMYAEPYNHCSWNW